MDDRARKVGSGTLFIPRWTRSNLPDRGRVAGDLHISVICPPLSAASPLTTASDLGNHQLPSNSYLGENAAANDLGRALFPCFGGFVTPLTLEFRRNGSFELYLSLFLADELASSREPYFRKKKKIATPNSYLGLDYVLKLRI